MSDHMESAPVERDRIKAIEARLEEGREIMMGHDEQLKLIRQELQENTDVTTDIRDLMSAGKTGLKVLGWIGVAAKWVASIALAITAVWGVIYTITHGGTPPK
jgi:hypothetical protein